MGGLLGRGLVIRVIYNTRVRFFGGCGRSENISAESVLTERFDQTAPLREICNGGYPLRDNS